MNAKEAIKYLKGMLFPSDMSESTLKAIAVNKMAIEALEKQVPKETTDIDPNSHEETPVLMCPNCYELLADKCGLEGKNSLFISYCWTCGQAIKNDKGV